MVEKQPAKRTMPTEEPQSEPDAPDTPVPATPPPARVAAHGDWHLVSYGAWQISIAPDGLIMLPRHLHNRDVNDFVGCLTVARDVATSIVAANERRAEAVKGLTPLPTRKAVVTQGPPPDGTMRMRMTSGQARSSTIGRAKRRQTGKEVVPDQLKNGRH